jgi:hypothetical protein
MICLELEKLTTLEAVRNLSEMVDEVGKEHANEVLALITEREVALLEDESHDPFESIDALRIAARIALNITDEANKPSVEEIDEFFDMIDSEIRDDKLKG